MRKAAFVVFLLLAFLPVFAQEAVSDSAQAVVPVQAEESPAVETVESAVVAEPVAPAPKKKKASGAKTALSPEDRVRALAAIEAVKLYRAGK